MDVTTAFLNGDLRETIYMSQPPGFIETGGEHKVCRLQKSLYGLKQAPLCWNQKIDSVLQKAGFVKTLPEYGVYMKPATKEFSVVLIGLYVDDLLLLSQSDRACRWAKDLLSSHFHMKDLGPVQRFLGMDITQTSSQVHLSLHSYIFQLLQHTGMLDCNPVHIPFASSTYLMDSSPLDGSDITEYRSLVGKLLFAANTGRPDISYAVSYLSRYMQTPLEEHMRGVKHLLRYLKGSMNMGITYQRRQSFKLTGYTDADWGGSKEDRKSTSGYVFMLGDSPITWRSKKQEVVALSTTEAEYIALSDGVKELLWLDQLINQIDLKLESIPVIWSDNTSCISLANHPHAHPRTKHIDIRHHHIRETLQRNKFVLKHMDTHHMIADIFTKGLARPQFEYLREAMGFKINHHSLN
ncbi:Polyprotein (gag/pol) of Ty1/Copia retrotransposon [Ogataea parapolymorpha DL-1]|uniref:Polyprotein (Gag/pol) of Ty1/Copia retrotransposon n=1 Tax=Ogataea parapolymorpha (strain ATCC 26012 / BCRC 20466 / JCM 22074 / NRRL Y-7560 / DL-1) TaxID=871575 RepID=W1QCY3_OGAPD|nr:Polyprotein (gag/pol) of Ty1/Copia retrotransposon [Ogataea parapolymorpha DL-1]XP_013936543.1 Polyprotein (gag/pol) of Ty1/Copia retrotransposon [Ogataea parapolymorpha DL-1]ESW98399.1 Polyprotein (gag/pol) of Ty1/Copia retrotransposon [Ogataea parapolymorpha DL-1]ESX01957.1 Polyprotein (gag/pol) of Ty1/Copia retrotransposon [Ogataea parapolymorpha DL-1]